MWKSEQEAVLGAGAAYITGQGRTIQGRTLQGRTVRHDRNWKIDRSCAYATSKPCMLVSDCFALLDRSLSEHLPAAVPHGAVCATNVLHSACRPKFPVDVCTTCAG
jgi:hypothetical protein